MTETETHGGVPGPAEGHDPYKMRTLEQILSLFDGGEFLHELMEKHRELQRQLLEFREEHGHKGCEGEVSIKLKYKVGKQRDVAMEAKSEIKGPKAPPSSAAAFLNDDGDITLYSPLLARMQRPVRDVTPHDPETGEVRDI
jgi:hypothetical protein